MLEDAWGCSEILWPQAAPERPPRRDEKMWTEAEGNRNPIQQGSWGVAIPQDWNWKKAIRWQLSATMRWRGRRLDAVSRRWPTVPSALPVAAAPVSPSIAIYRHFQSHPLSLSLSVCVCVCVCMCSGSVSGWIYIDRVPVPVSNAMSRSCWKKERKKRRAKG